MRITDLEKLREQSLISESQFQHLESIYSARQLSIYYELRIILYLGVMLFTSGTGILIYKNIGEVGHLLAISGLFLLTTAGLIYCYKNRLPYTHQKSVHPLPYFDYAVLLTCLLLISGLTYLQLQYSLFDDTMGSVTLVIAVILFYLSYRYDHLGVLSLAITALASFWSLSISPQEWYKADFLDQANLHLTAMLFGSTVTGAALLLDRLNIKVHFTFTYVNFAALIYFCGALSGMFTESQNYGYYLLAVYLGCAFCIYFARTRRSFLFLLYAFVFGYIGTTYLLADTILNEAGLWFLYLIASCGGLVVFITRFKNFSRGT